MSHCHRRSSLCLCRLPFGRSEHQQRRGVQGTPPAALCCRPLCRLLPMPLRAAGTALPPTRCCRRCYGSYVFVQPPPLILGLAGARAADGGSSREMGEQQQQRQPGSSHTSMHSDNATAARPPRTSIRTLTARNARQSHPGAPAAPSGTAKPHHRQQNESFWQHQKHPSTGSTSGQRHKRQAPAAERR